MKHKSIFLLIFIFMYCYSFSQIDKLVKIKLNSKIPDTISSDSSRVIVLTVQGFSNEKIYVENIHDQTGNFKIQKKINDKFISIDSLCIMLTQSNYPKGGFKLNRLLKGQVLKITYLFPDCFIYEPGVFRIKFLFTYFKSNKIATTNKPYSAETEWYEFSSNVVNSLKRH